MDDDEPGRPTRHARESKHSKPQRLTQTIRGGAGAVVQVKGTSRCACGAEIAVDFTGAEDSIGVRVAKHRLAEPRCESCEAADDIAQASADAQQLATVTIRDRVAKCGVPNAWRTLSFGELEQHPQAYEHQLDAIAAAKAWALEGGGLLLHGPVGRGKTLIAAAATVQRCAIGGVRWLPVAKLLMDLRMPFEAPEYVRAQRQLEVARSTALVLDDLDKLKPTEHALQPLYVAINGWIEARQPLLVTCNRDLDSLAEWMGETFGDPIASRLAGYCDVLEIKGDDWRLA